MWDERYSAKTYAYGTEPNDFLRDNFQHIPKGKVLSLAEGEGRNAVFLAKQGYEVTAVDASQVGLDKAKKLADKHGVSLNLIHADLGTFDIGQACWDGIVSIYCPLPALVRQSVHQKVVAGLKDNGVYLLEAYRPEQVNNDTGGGKSAETMQSAHTLTSELNGLRIEYLQELERDVIEGHYHTGRSAVVQCIAQKQTEN